MADDEKRSPTLVPCSLGSHKIKAVLGIYAVLSTTAQYISCTLLCYVNTVVITVQHNVLHTPGYKLVAHSYGEFPWLLYILPLGCALVQYI